MFQIYKYSECKSDESNYAFESPYLPNYFILYIKIINRTEKLDFSSNVIVKIINNLIYIMCNWKWLSMSNSCKMKLIVFMTFVFYFKYFLNISVL